MSVSTLDAPTQELTARDRCDRCGAQAFVMTRQPNGFELLWCGHHFAENEPHLLGSGASIAEDTRHLLSA